MNTDSKGFEIALGITKRIIKIRVWGKWDADFRGKYAMALREKIEEVRLHWKDWYVLVDFTGFSSQTDEVHSIMSQSFTKVDKQGMRKVAYLGYKIQTPLQLEQSGEEEIEQQQSFFQSKTEALRWLMNGE